MNSTSYNFFKFGKLILFLALFFCQFFSYGETDENSLFVPEILESPVSETTSLEVSEGEMGHPNLIKSSQLNVKGELFTTATVNAVSVIPLVLIALEFQTPVIMENKRLNWLAQIGGGAFLSGTTPYLSLDTGLRYDFQPSTTVSLTLGVGGFAPFLSGKSILSELMIRSILSVGWKLSNEVHLALNAGFAGTINFPAGFIGLSASIPLKKW